MKNNNRITRTIANISSIFTIAAQPSFYPEKQRKLHLVRVWDLLEWYVKHHEVNNYYNAYGLDLKERNKIEYIDDHQSFRKTRDRLNSQGKAYSMSCLLEDKFLFFKAMQLAKLPTPTVFAFLLDGRLYDADMNEISFDDIAPKKDYFLKDAYGICGNLVMHIKDHNHFKETCKKLKKGGYILQERVLQCAKESEMYPRSVNTLRVITVMKPGQEPYLFTMMHRFGTKKSGDIDNWAVGGLAIKVNKDGYLDELGYYKYNHGTTTTVHPDTGVVFKDYKVPMLDEAIALALKAHKYFYNIHSIGWDIAMTDNGPVFIEGNENWGIPVFQTLDRPMKKAWLDAIK